MGCASAVNRHEEDDPSGQRIIRIDLGSIKSTATPKNEISLMKMTEQLLKVLEALCEEDRDEVTYLLSVAKELMQVFGENGNILNLCYDLVTHLGKMLELNQKTFAEKEQWYYRYSYVLIYEISEFKNILGYILENGQLKQQYARKTETIYLYACILGTIRFLEGISWGYSVFLMHQQLDVDHVLATKVLLNLMMRLKQHFKENKAFVNAFQSDKPAAYQAEFYFKSVLSYSSIEKLITEGVDSAAGGKKDERRWQNNQFLSNQVFRKTYVHAKKQMDDWLRKVAHSDVSVPHLKAYKSIKTFTRSYLRELKSPANKPQTPEAQQEQAQQLPTFEVDNSSNIMVVVGADQDTKLIVESFLQANVKTRTKYKCCMLHHCVRENKMTHDAYYIAKSIIFSIMRTVPSLRNFLKLQEHNFVKEMILTFDQERLDLQKDYPEVLVKFFKVLKEIKLDYNIGLFITGMENLLEYNKLESVVYLLRCCSLYLPNFIKLIVTIDRLSSVVNSSPGANSNGAGGAPVNQNSSKKKGGEEHFHKILKILATDTIVKVNDSEVFLNEGRSYMDFALNFAQGQSASGGQVGGQQNNEEARRTSVRVEDGATEETKINTTDQNQNNLQAATIKSNLELSLQKAELSYRKCIEMIHGIYRSGINPKDNQMVKEFLLNFQSEDQLYRTAISQALELNSEVATLVLNSLSALHGPIHLETFVRIHLLSKTDFEQHQLAEIELRKILKVVAKGDVLFLSNSQIQKINARASSDELLENNKTILCLKRKQLLKEVLWSNFQIKLARGNFHELVYKYHLATFESGEVESEFEDLDSYFRIYVYRHLAKTPTCAKVFAPLENLFCVKNIYKQILYHRSYGRFRNKLAEMIDSIFIDREEKQQLVQFSNILYLIEQTIKNEPLNFLDFCTQLRGRILGESLSEFLTDLRLDITSENICYFKNFHHALRENPRIDQIIKFPRCTVLRIKFFLDKKRVLLSLSNGLLLVYSLIDYSVVKIFANRFAIVDNLKIIDDKYIITSGIDPKIRIWNMETEKIISEFEAHQYATTLMQIMKEFVFSYGSDLRLIKYNFKDKRLEGQLQLESPVTAMKLVKTLEESHKLKLAVGLENGTVSLYDLNLSLLRTVTLKASNEEIIQIINVSNTEFLCFTKEGTIAIMNNSTLEETKPGSIFNIKNEDYIDLILIKSKEFFLFTLERQKIEFYSASSFKRTDSWDYFFERDLICCDKNKEGSKIFVSDKAGYTVLFNFLKNLDQNKENLVPCNRRYDPVVCIEVTERLESNSIISCSQDRDLRIWRRDNGVFIKKYDLSSFTGENITAMKLGKDENMLFLGSKDMNVYLIDISKGKLCVVYEGHWNRVTQIYTIPNKDILITISESNIKVWDLEYDECIKNMNEHNSAIVYIAQVAPTGSSGLPIGGLGGGEEEQVMTIGQSFELKQWNYVTGNISQAHEIELNKDKKQLKNMHVVCCDVVQQDMAYIALNTNEINVYSIKENRVLYSFISYNDEQIIFLNGIKTENASYLIVVTRTACVLYLVGKEQVKRLCSYLVNARKKPKKKKHDNKYSYNVRYYFTSAKVTALVSSPQANTHPTNPTGGAKRMLSKNINQTNANLMGEDMNLLSSSKNQLGDDEGQSLLGKQNHSSSQQFLMGGHGSNMNISGLGGREGGASAFSNYNGTKIVDTMGTRIKDTVVLVCLGDSRGFVHMNHLILK